MVFKFKTGKLFYYQEAKCQLMVIWHFVPHYDVHFFVINLLQHFKWEKAIENPLLPVQEVGTVTVSFLDSVIL